MTELVSLMETALKHPQILDEEFKNFRPKSKLGSRWADLIKMRFCIDKKLYTLKEVGAKFGVTRERVFQLENDLIKIILYPRVKGKLKNIQKDKQ